MSSQPTHLSECIPDLLRPEKVREVLDRPFPPESIKSRPGSFGQIPQQKKTSGDVRHGFVYKRVPHIMLSSISRDEEIDDIHAKWQKKLETVRKDLNKAAKQKWQEWEIHVVFENLLKNHNAPIEGFGFLVVYEYWFLFSNIPARPFHMTELPRTGSTGAIRVRHR